MSGFGLFSNPEALIEGVLDRGVRHRTLVSNNAGSVGLGLARWLKAGIVARFIGSYVGHHEDLQRARRSGQVEVELVPQGALVERLRAAGAGLAGLFAPAMAMAARVSIAEAEEVVPLGSIDADDVHLSGAFVQRVVEVRASHSHRQHHPRRGSGVWLQSENGLLGMGLYLFEGEEDPQLINAGQETVTMRAGASTFDSATSFAMFRGGHVDLAILGALEVAANGDIANWSVPGKRVMGIGGAMDLAAGARRVVTMLTHVAKDGAPKLGRTVAFPITAVGVVCSVRARTFLWRLRSRRRVRTVAPGLNSRVFSSRI